MKLHHALERSSERPLALAIGFFDGMHRGHAEIARAAKRLRKPGWRLGVLSFSNHPAAFLRPGSEPQMITTPEERIDLFAKAGFEECFFIQFNEHIATMSPNAFLELLVDGLGVRAVAVGKTFRYGHKRAGDTTMMQEYFAVRNIAFAPFENVVAGNGERISSTRIRALIGEGDLETADRLLGHSYELRGTVEIGFGRGHDLGFPTANIRAPQKLLPKDGVYASVARYDGRDYAALVSIGTNPQFNGKERTIEAWLRDFHDSVYGREIALRDLRLIREQQTFANTEALVAQMTEDLKAVAYPAFG